MSQLTKAETGALYRQYAEPKEDVPEIIRHILKETAARSPHQQFYKGSLKNSVSAEDFEYFFQLFCLGMLDAYRQFGHCPANFRIAENTSGSAYYHPESDTIIVATGWIRHLVEKFRCETEHAPLANLEGLPEEAYLTHEEKARHTGYEEALHGFQSLHFMNRYGKEDMVAIPLHDSKSGFYYSNTVFDKRLSASAPEGFHQRSKPEVEAKYFTDEYAIALAARRSAQGDVYLGSVIGESSLRIKPPAKIRGIG